jgi:hypothetical protein
MATQDRLKADPGEAAAIGRKLFPAEEAELIAELIRRDAPYYSPVISPRTVSGMNAFCRHIGILKGDPAYDAVVDPAAAALWTR